MNEHVADELVGLLTGELGPAEARAVATHLRTCPECTTALVEVAVAHWALTAAARAESELSVRPVATAVLAGADAAPPQPPLRLPRSRTRALRLVAAAAVVVVAAGAALGVSLASRHHAAPVAAVATLHPLQAPADAAGDVVVHAVGDTLEMSLTTRHLPTPPADDFYEVWLYQPATGKMLPIGILAPTGTGSYGISVPVMAQFDAIDVSLQRDDGDPAHSDHSVLRGMVRTTSA